MSANQQILAALSSGPVVGQALLTTATDNQAWTVPAGVTSISVVCIGPGFSSNSALMAHGGCLRYVNNISVTPGETLRVDLRDNGARLRRGATVLCYGPNYQNRASAVGSGGDGGVSGDPGSTAGGGGGAGGYSGSGGAGGGTASGALAGSGTGGGGAGGAGNTNTSWRGGGGGGVGVLGEGASAIGGANSSTTPSGGSGGSGGSAGLSGDSSAAYPSGGNYGGGGNSYNGAVRIIWPGNLRQFPSTRTADE